MIGNKNSSQKLSIGTSAPIRFLSNIGHMSTDEPLDAEKRKVEIAYKYGIDIIADNSITEKSWELRRWIKRNFPLMLNTVPIYECFTSMKEGTFSVNQLIDAVQSHIDNGSDMIVVHPGITQQLALKIDKSNRVIKITSRGGSQIYRYMKTSGIENPYYEHWDEFCKLLKGTGVSLAIGLSLRAGSIVDSLNPLYIEEMDIVGDLTARALQYNIPVVVEGVGHVRAADIPAVLLEIRRRCSDVPIKTLGPVVSDRMLAMEHINALIGSTIAACFGASIIGALFRSEHVGLPTVEDYEESLRNYAILKYVFNMTSQQEKDERAISICRSGRQWMDILQHSFFNDEAAKKFFAERHDHQFDICTMCGERCALLKSFRV